MKLDLSFGVQENGGILWGYKKWQTFELVIKKAILSCENSGTESKSHFTDASKMVNLGSGSKRNIKDYGLM